MGQQLSHVGLGSDFLPIVSSNLKVAFDLFFFSQVA